MTPKNITDISERTWEDLYGTEGEDDGAEHSILRELASEREGVDGNGSREEICVGLLAWQGRQDEIPEQYREEYDDAIEAALEGSADPEAEVTEEVEAAEDESEEEPAEDDAEDEEPAEPPTADDREVEEGEDDGGDEARNQKLGNADEPARRDASFIIDAGVLQGWLDNADSLVDECRIHLHQDELRIRAVDPANVAMVDTSLEARAFESFDVGDVGVIGVNLGRVIDVTKGPNAGDLIHIEFDAERRNLVISYGGHEFTLGLIDPASIRKEPDIPELDLSVEVEFEEASVLRQAIKYADDVSDHVAFSAEDEVFAVSASGDTDSYEARFEDREEVTFNQYGEAKSLFSNDYLKPISGAWAKDVPVEVEVGVEFPVVMRQPVEDDERHVGEATFLVAPRIQAD